MTTSALSESARHDEESVRAELVAWLREHWDPDLSLIAWRQLLTDAGWAAPTWPERWHGRGLPSWSARVVSEELARAGAVGLPVGPAATLAGPTILEHGPDALRERFLRPILTGEETWCQLFSEPGAGSDLAGVTTTAVLDGDEWVINGQKVWNTSAHHADYGLMLARSDWEAPKHRGLTYFVLPMRQAGVEVRPLRQMNGYSSFNEVFIADARVPADHVVGEVGDGWTIALTTLAHERRFATMQRPSFPKSGRRAHTDAQAEADAHFATYRWYPQRAGRADLLVEFARSRGVDGDPVVRQEIAKTLSMRLASQWTAERARATRAIGRAPGAEGSIGKLAASDLARQAARTHSLIAGASGLVTEGAAPYGGTIAEVLVSVPAQSIAGGTDEIQRNIVGEKVLGLPREPSHDKTSPFRDVARNT